MAREAIEIGIVIERRRLKHPWADPAWLPVAVLPGAAAAAPWTVLDDGPEATRFYAGAQQIEFNASDTGTYRDNLRSGRPSLWVALCFTDVEPGIEVQIVTADPSEGEALTETGTLIVEAVAMPVEIGERLAAFVEAHHVERAFTKRKRDRADPEAMALRPRGRGGAKEGE